MDAILNTQLVDPALLRADSFQKFYAARKAALVVLVERAMGKAAASASMVADDEDEEEKPKRPDLAKKRAPSRARSGRSVGEWMGGVERQSASRWSPLRSPSNGVAMNSLELSERTHHREVLS